MPVIVSKLTHALCLIPPAQTSNRRPSNDEFGIETDSMQLDPSMSEQH
jgi:hypothetical protein